MHARTHAHTHARTHARTQARRHERTQARTRPPPKDAHTSKSARARAPREEREREEEEKRGIEADRQHAHWNLEALCPLTRTAGAGAGIIRRHGLRGDHLRRLHLAPVLARARAQSGRARAGGQCARRRAAGLMEAMSRRGAAPTPRSCARQRRPAQRAPDLPDRSRGHAGKRAPESGQVPWSMTAPCPPLPGSSRSAVSAVSPVCGHHVDPRPSPKKHVALLQVQPLNTRHHLSVVKKYKKQFVVHPPRCQRAQGGGWTT